MTDVFMRRREAHGHREPGEDGGRDQSLIKWIMGCQPPTEARTGAWDGFSEPLGVHGSPDTLI
jgi:hypothetical protein